MDIYGACWMEVSMCITLHNQSMCSSSVEHFIQPLYQADALEVALFPSEVCLFHQTLIYESGWILFS